VELTSLYEYYEHQTIAPTFANLQTEAAIADYARARAELLGGRLAIPLPLLRGAEILEFGPDTGENAVAFARAGARLTLVEPALAAHAQIQTYFERFAPPGALRGLVAGDVLGYVPHQRFDLVVAEGFIYTVQPSTRWLDAFVAALVPGGLALVSYYERRATLFELLMKVPFAALQRHTGADRLTVAERLYRPKWDAIAHTRSFESWTMDVLANPFVRLRYFIDAGELAADAASRCFAFHATWPSYVDGLENVWAKRRVTPQATLARTQRHLARSVLTFILGTKAYLVDDRDAAAIAELADTALAAADALVDADDAVAAAQLEKALRGLAEASRSAQTIVDSASALEAGTALLDAWADVIADVRQSDLAAAAARLRTDRILIDGWGTPNHLAVLRLGAPLEQS
jgi:hypothetical protein